MTRQHFTSLEHELNATRKAMRGLRAAVSLVGLPDTSDEPLFTGGPADRLEQLNDYLFGDNVQLAAALWTALGIQDRRLAGRLTATSVSDVTDFRTSRPLIRDLIANHVEALRNPIADPFEGL